MITIVLGHIHTVNFLAPASSTQPWLVQRQSCALDMLRLRWGLVCLQHIVEDVDLQIDIDCWLSKPKNITGSTYQTCGHPGCMTFELRMQNNQCNVRISLIV